MTDVKRSPEEQERYDADVNRGAAAGAQFRRVYPEFDPSKPANVQKMRKLVEESGEMFSFDLLSRLFQGHRSEFELVPERKEEPAPAPKPEKKDRTEVRPEWWTAVESKDTIDAIAREDFRRFMRDPNFVKTVERVANGGTR